MPAIALTDNGNMFGAIEFYFAWANRLAKEEQTYPRKNDRRLMCIFIIIAGNHAVCYGINI